MPYRLVYTKRASRDIAKLERNIKERIKKALERYSQSPHRHARKLANPALATYRFRIGDYWVIFDIEDDEIIVLRVGHRREIYRR